MAIFPTFFLGNKGQGNVVYHILERKNVFVGYKKKKFKKWKTWHFFIFHFFSNPNPNPWFWSKHGHFCNFFFLGNIGHKKVFYDILERKNAFLGYKTRISKNQKTDIFPKGLTHGFGPKMAIFPTFYFRQYRPGKCLLWYPRTKKRISRL